MQSEAEKAFGLQRMTEGNGAKASNTSTPKGLKQIHKLARHKRHSDKKKKNINMEAWFAAKLLTGTSHGWRVFVCSEVIILTPAVH